MTSIEFPMATSPRRLSSSDGRQLGDKSFLSATTNLSANLGNSVTNVDLQIKCLQMLDESTDLPTVKLRSVALFSSPTQYRRYSSPDRRHSTSNPSSRVASRVHSRCSSPNRLLISSKKELDVTEGSVLEALSHSILTDTALNNGRITGRLPSLFKGKILSTASEDGSSFPYSSPLLIKTRSTLGCNRDKGSILARANERTTKQTNATISREHVNAVLIETYTRSIAEKSSREELKATQKINAKRRKLWQKMIYIILFPSTFLTKLPQLKIRETTLTAASKIWYFYQKHKARKKAARDAICLELMRLNFIRAFRSLRKIVQHWRSKIAVARLKSFLTTCGAFRLRKFSSGYILRYVRAVKLVQGKVRLFLQCQAAHLRALDKLWEVAESKYITSMVRLTMNTVTLRPMNYSLINADVKLDKKWDYIESKFATFELHKQNAHQYRIKRAGRDSVAGFVLDKSVRTPYLKGILNTAVRLKK